MGGPIRTDEPLDRVFSRPVAALLVKGLARTPISANQVTGIACLCGVGIGVALWFEQGLVAVICTLAYLAFDCADGQLARIRGGGGYLGRAMDGLGDYVTALAVHVGLAVWISRGSGWVIGWTLTALAGGSMAWASLLLDRYKRRYRGDTDDLEALRAEVEATSGMRGWLVSTLEPYAKRLDAGVRVTDREAYQQRTGLPMVLWLVNGPTSHFTVMALCVLLGRPGVYAWIAIGPMLLLTLLTLWFQHRAETKEPAVIESP